MSWWEKLFPPKIQPQKAGRRSVPEGVWTKCSGCDTALYSAEIEVNVCPQCGHHLRISARQRLEAFLDLHARETIGENLLPVDSLKFKDTQSYADRLKAARLATGETDALIVMRGTVLSVPLVAACFEFSFMGGSMGAVVGARFAAGIAAAIAAKLPFVCFTATGGARMQEGLFSLMQMAKTTAMLTKLSARKLPFISVLTDPTMGGVSASFAFMGDIVLAEPKALIGFAGPRVIKNTVGEKLPEGFQRAEFLLEKGAIDAIVDRRHMREAIARFLLLLQNQSLETLG